jgi:hypothetical protein
MIAVMGAEAAVNAVFANKIAAKPEAERAAYVEELRARVPRRHRHPQAGRQPRTSTPWCPATSCATSFSVASRPARKVRSAPAAAGSNPARYDAAAGHLAGGLGGRRAPDSSVRRAPGGRGRESVPLEQARRPRAGGAPLWRRGPAGLPPRPHDGYDRAVRRSGRRQRRRARAARRGGRRARRRAPGSRPSRWARRCAIPTGGHLPAGADAVVMNRARRGRGGRHRWSAATVERGRTRDRAGRGSAQRAEVLAPGAGCARPILAPIRGARRAGGGRLAGGRAWRALHGAPRSAPDGHSPPGRCATSTRSCSAAAASAAGCQVEAAGIGERKSRRPGAAHRRARSRPRRRARLGRLLGGRPRPQRAEVFEYRWGRRASLFPRHQRAPRQTDARRTAGATLLVGLRRRPHLRHRIFEVFVRPACGSSAARPAATHGQRAARRGSRARIRRRSATRTTCRVRLVDRERRPRAELVSGARPTLSNVPQADGLVVVRTRDRVAPASAPRSP